MKKTVFCAAAAAIGIGVLASQASAATIVNDFGAGIVVSNGFAYVDVDGDGANDVFVADQYYDTLGYHGGASGATADYYSYGYVLADNDGNAIDLGYGTDVDAGTAAAFGGTWTRMSTTFFDTADASVGPLPTVGDSGFFAVMMDHFTVSPQQDGCNGCEFGFEEEYIETFYAWIEVEHGSVIVGSAGVGDAPGAAATTPTLDPGNGSKPGVVPLPAGLPLLLAGLGALGLVRRRG